MRHARTTNKRWSVRLTVASVLGLLLAGAGPAVTAGAADAAAPGPARLSAAPPVPGDATRFVAAMQPGWGPGNSLDAIPDETAWGNPPISKALLDRVRSMGFNSIRIPVTWGIHEGAAPTYTVDPAFLTRVRQVVDWALSDGFYVVLNLHHDSWQWINKMPADPAGVLAQYTATWTQIADTFRNEPDRLVLESINEPQFSNATDAQAAPLLDQLNTTFHRLVRQSGGNNATRFLLLPTLGDTPTKPLMDDLVTTIQSLHDPRLIASVHYYGFWPFAVNIANFTQFNATVQQDLDTDFGLMHSEFVANGIPVVAGEVGLLNYDYTRPGIIERGETLKYFEALGYDARANGVTTNLWDAGSFVDRNTLQLRDPGLFAQMRSSWTTRSGTASADLVFVPKSKPVTDQVLTLNPNGTTFTGLCLGATRLAAGRDYTVSGDQLTLTSALLTRLVGSRAYGVDATLTAHFSRGVPWSINVITNDPPVVTSATGTTSSFAVPTRFNGDVLATMQAVYADGSNAGPANWTSYQEYSTAFAADYTAGAVTLTPDFFNSVTDGARVTLTFHFWSGASVTYYVTKSGSTVTGTIS